MGQYDFSQLYGQADNTNFVYESGLVDGVVETASWGRTKDGTKGQWDIRLRTTTGPNAGRLQLRRYLTVTATGENAGQSLGIMFRQLAALGVPVPDPQNPNQIVNGQAPFWAMGWNEEQVAQAMVGKPVLMSLGVRDFEGVQRNEVRDLRPPRPGAPTTWPSPQQQPQGAPAAFGAMPGMPFPPQPQQGYMPGVGAPSGYEQPQPGYGPPQFQQPGYLAAPAPYGGPQQPAAPAAPSALWQQPQAAPAPNGAQGGYNPAIPPFAQPPVPGQGGFGEFTPQGQSYQPSTAPFPPQPQQPQQQQQQQAPAPQYAQPQYSQPQYPGAPQQQQAAPAQAPGAVPWNGQQPGQAQPAAEAGPQGAPPPPWAN